MINEIYCYIYSIKWSDVMGFFIQMIFYILGALLAFNLGIFGQVVGGIMIFFAAINDPEDFDFFKKEKTTP